MLNKKNPKFCFHTDQKEKTLICILIEIRVLLNFNVVVTENIWCNTRPNNRSGGSVYDW